MNNRLIIPARKSLLPRRKFLIGAGAALCAPAIVRAQAIIGSGIYDAPASASAYTANGVTFNGTSTYAAKGTALSGVASGKTGLASLWLKNTGAAGTTRAVVVINTSGSVGLLYLFVSGASNKIAIQGKNSSDTVILQAISNDTFTGMSDYVHCLISWDVNTATSRVQIRIDDVSNITAGPTLTDATIVYTGTRLGIGGDNAGASLFPGDLADVQIWLNVDVDISVEANRRLFIDAGGNAVNPIVAEASLGTADILLHGDASTWFINAGGGGGFTPNDGSLANAATDPP